MPRIAYVNGRYLPHARARVHIEDRGYQFADGVYEVIAVSAGRLVDARPHFARLARSLAKLAIPSPMSDAALAHVIGEVVRRNRIRDGMVYLQITRGVAPRDHVVASGRAPRPALVVTARTVKPVAPAIVAEGCAVITVPDIRWRRCDIKSISLLPNVLAKQAAYDAGASEALLVDDEGMVTEGSASNAWIVTADGTVVTRPADHAILDGVTRRTVIGLAAEAGLRVEERRFSLAEAKAAAEVFLTGTTARVLPVRSIDGAPVGEEAPGPFTRRLMEAYGAYVAAGASAGGPA